MLERTCLEIAVEVLEGAMQAAKVKKQLIVLRSSETYEPQQ